MILIFDTETTGFVNRRLPLSDPSQPHLVQLAAQLCQDDGTARAALNVTIKPDGYEIPAASAAVHGISTELAMGCGVPLVSAVYLFFQMRARAHTIVAHNASFDKAILDIARHRMPVRDYPDWPAKWVCTMQASLSVVDIPPTEKMLAKGMTQPKNPSLQEIYRFLFGHDFAGAHDAMVDVTACQRVYFELMRRGCV